ncbi:MAG: hypothetical protein LAP21_08360 [Acidobacteriia bacterium]|nr:hypothetical protein [Terriglobia bacterium]
MSKSQTLEPADVKRVAEAAGDTGRKPTGEPVEMAATSGPPKLDKLPFFDMLKALQARDWEDRMVYLYRQDKNIIKEDPKDSNYIDRVPHAFDEAYVKDKFGGGRFLAILKNTRINGAERKYSFLVEGEPIITQGEVQISKGKAGAGGGNPEMTMLLEQMNTLISRVVTMAQDKGGSDGDAVTKVIETMQKATDGVLQVQRQAFERQMGSPTGSPMTDKFMEAMIARMAAGEQDSMKKLLEMMAVVKQLQGGGEAKPGLLGIVGELKGLAEAARELGVKIGGEGGGVEGAMDWKTALAASLPQALGAVSGWVNDFIASYRERNRVLAQQIEAMRRTGQALPAAQTSAPPPAAPAAVATSALPANFAAAPAAAASAPASQAQVIEFPEPGGDQVQVDFSFVAGLVRRSFDAGDHGATTAVMLKRLFADSFGQFKQYLNDESKLKTVCAMEPQLAAILQEEDFPQFSSEFIEEMNRKEGEEEPGPEAPPA